MKKFLLGTVALVALGTASAVAADLPCPDLHEGSCLRSGAYL